MQIHYIAPTYLPSRRANTFQVMKMAAALAGLGHTVTMLVPLPGGRHPDGSAPDWPDLAAHYGLDSRFEIRWIRTTPNLRSYDFGIRAASAVRGTDLVITRHPQAAAAAGVRGLPVVLEIHDVPKGRGGPRLFRYFLTTRGARGIVAISRALLADLEAGFKFPERLHLTVEPDGVDLERYQETPNPSEARAALGLPERFTAVYTGHLYAGRGVGLLLKLAERLPETAFVIAGGREEDVARVRGQAAALENVHVTGFIPNKALPTWQAAGDVLLMPYQRTVAASSGGDISRYLSPMELFEYLASGRPILSSDLPVFREVLDEHLAVLLPPDDVRAWETAFRALADDPDRRAAMGRQGRAVAAGYSWRARAARILEAVSR